MEPPPPEVRQLSVDLHGSLDFNAHLSSKQVTNSIRHDWRLLALLGILVVGLPIATWWLPFPGAASVGIAVVAGLGLSWLGYKAIGDVISTTIRE